MLLVENTAVLSWSLENSIVLEIPEMVLLESSQSTKMNELEHLDTSHIFKESKVMCQVFHVESFIVLHLLIKEEYFHGEKLLMVLLDSSFLSKSLSYLNLDK